MNIRWSEAARADLGRLYDFLSRRDLHAADEVLDRLIGTPKSLLSFRRRGEKLTEYEPLEVRELRVGRYVVRYQLTDDWISILRIFHLREDRF